VGEAQIPMCFLKLSPYHPTW